MYTTFSIYNQRRETGGGECAPYARQLPTSMDIDLVSPIAVLAPNLINVDLCEVMT